MLKIYFLSNISFLYAYISRHDVLYFHVLQFCAAFSRLALSRLWSVIFASCIFVSCGFSVSLICSYRYSN